jgi:DNA sulfur modification protein DndB
MDYSYKFPVVRGIQAKKEYYIAMVPLKMLPKLFSNDDEYVLPEYRAQRKINLTRIPVISDYILKNRETYVFSALAASIDGEYSYISSGLNRDIGMLEVSMESRFLINDGQHRKAAILEALKEDATLGNETISVVFFEDEGLNRSQQIFTDLNKHAVKTSNSIAELYDSRDEVAVMTRKVISGIDFLDCYTDKEKDNLGKFSSNFFTLHTFYEANKKIFNGCKPDDNSEKFLLDFWKLITAYILPWQELQNKKICKQELREDYIITQGIVIKAIGRIGAYFYEHKKISKKRYLSKLKNINWKRNAKQWQYRTIKENGRMLTNNEACVLTANMLKHSLEIPLTDYETKIENSFIQARK